MKRLIAALLFIGTLVGQTTKLGIDSSAQTMIGHINKLPPFQYSVYKELGCAVSWAQVNRSAGVYNTTNFDACATTAIGAGATTIIFNIGYTPNFISANPRAASPQFYPPTDLNSDGTGTDATFKAFLTFIMAHAAATFPTVTRIYENYNEPSATFQGTNAQLVRMEQDSILIRNSVDPTGLIGSAPFSGLYGTTGKNDYIAYLTAGGAVNVDRVAFHGYIQDLNNGGGNVPSTILTNVIAFMRTEKSTYGLTGELADTEYSWLTSAFTGDQTAFVGESVLVQQQPDIALANWWSYDMADGTLVTVPGGSTLNGAGIAMQILTTSWLPPGSVMTSPCAVVTGTQWSCTVTNNGIVDLILFDTAGTSSYSLPGGYANSTQFDLTGGVNVVSGTGVTLSPRPLLFQPNSNTMPTTNLVTVSQTVTGPDNSLSSGTAVINISAPCASGGNFISYQTVTVPFTLGAFSTSLLATDQCPTAPGIETPSAYSSGTAYVPNNTVMYSGGIYINILASTNIPVNNALYWTRISPTYTVKWTISSGKTWTESWAIPTSSVPVSIASVRINMPPLPALPVPGPMFTPTGVTCSGTPSSSFATVNGIVTHC